ncbi:hypothetical protein LTR85_009206 [Meristemomyces frigidus]|nr:hypothetical protein LTR85_009206 [Meristemomyces frigidus]
MSTQHIEDLAAAMESDTEVGLSPTLPAPLPRSPTGVLRAPLLPLDAWAPLPPPAFTTLNSDWLPRPAAASTLRASPTLIDLHRTPAVPAAGRLPGLFHEDADVEIGDTVTLSSRHRQPLRFRHSAHPSSPLSPISRPSPSRELPYALTPVFQPTHYGQKILTCFPKFPTLTMPPTSGWVTHATNHYDILLSLLAADVNMTRQQALRKYCSFLALLLTYQPFVYLFGIYRRIQKIERNARSYAQRNWLTQYPRSKQDTVE